MNFPEQRLKICAAARTYAGVPWVGQGRSHQGIDCAGLIIMAYRDAGWELIEPRPDYQGIDQRRLAEVLARYFQKLRHGEGLFPADLAIYGYSQDMHFALLLDGKRMNAIHCPYQEKVVEARFDPTRYKIRGFYRWRQFYSPSPS